jgi:uncharacterized DUF497 family protein
MKAGRGDAETFLFRGVLFVVHTEVLPGGRIRVISARKASTSHRRKYEEV